MVAITVHSSNTLPISIKQDTTIFHAFDQGDHSLGGALLGIFFYIFLWLCLGEEPISTFLLGILCGFPRRDEPAYTHPIVSSLPPTYGTATSNVNNDPAAARELARQQERQRRLGAARLRELEQERRRQSQRRSPSSDSGGWGDIRQQQQTQTMIHNVSHGGYGHGGYGGGGHGGGGYDSSSYDSYSD
ncbi:hypothetical protein GGR57DRAFT_93083 [Xylariaceae sp. FL1272]|nr:hypothetical protein GGR57DRAFT_93083 [Xylariaceae sp. FL1272]